MTRENLEVRFETVARADETPPDRPDQAEEGVLPKDFSYLQYAYHLRNRGERGKAPKGFVEFFDSNERRIATLENKWIIVEDILRKTTGEPPNLRLRVERDSVARILLTRTAVVIMGYDTNSPVAQEFEPE